MGSKILEVSNIGKGSVERKNTFVLLEMLAHVIIDNAGDLGVEELTKFFPIVGPIFSSALSFVMVHNCLTKCIDNLENNALEILEKTVEGSGY